MQQPKVIILENITTYDKQNTFKVIREELEKLGYQLNYEVLDTCKFSEIPQRFPLVQHNLNWAMDEGDSNARMLLSVAGVRSNDVSVLKASCC